jgi:hypothetical protein
MDFASCILFTADKVIIAGVHKTAITLSSDGFQSELSWPQRRRWRFPRPKLAAFVGRHR